MGDASEADRPQRSALAIVQPTGDEMTKSTLRQIIKQYWDGVSILVISLREGAVVLVGTKKALGMAVHRADTGQRYTAVRGRLENAATASRL